MHSPDASGPLAQRKIGEILIAEGKITQEQLEQALKQQRKDPRHLGKILISLGYAKPTDLAQALAKRLKLDYVVISDLSEDEVDPDALNLLDEETLRKYKALPLRFEDGRLVMAMSEPNDNFALEDLRIIAKRPVTPVVVTEEDLRSAFDHLFGPEDGLYPEVVEENPVEAEAEPETLSSGDAELRGAVMADSPRGSKEIALRDENSTNGSLAKTRPQSGKRTNVGAAKISDTLVSQGKVSEEQVQRALEAQKGDRRDVGKIMVSLGFISESDLALAEAQRLKLDYIELTERDVDRGVADLIPEKVLRKHGAMPLRIDHAGRLAVAMIDPTNIFALEDLRMISGYRILPLVATEADIRRVQAKVFSAGEEVTRILEEAAGADADDPAELDLGLDASPEEKPVIRLVSSILQHAIGDGASDIHVEPRRQELTVRFRVDGVLREAMSVPPKLQSGVVARLKILANLDIAERRLPQDGRFSAKLSGQKIDLRVASLPTVYGEKVVLRLLDTSRVEADLAKLGFGPRALERYAGIFRRPYGTILVTGPTGSGKSTTLYATLEELNSPQKNIITVEDPVEYRMHEINQIQVNPKAGLTFASALRSILRADPDIMMIGEIRDFETAKIAVEAALTGHLVLATLHTNDAPSAVNRLTDMGVEPFLTSSAIDCVVAQRLARRLCERCKEPVEIEAEILAGMRFPFGHAPEGRLNFYKAVGCNRCGGLGYRGRIGVYEVMVVTDEMKGLILRRASVAEIGRAAEEGGMVRLRDDGLLKAAQGLTTIEEVLRTVS